MNSNADEISNATLLSKLPKHLVDKLDQLIDLLKILLNLTEENFEEKSTFLLNSDFYHLIDMYEMFITVSLNICFFWPRRIPIISKMFTTFHKKDRNGNSMITKQIINNHILHGYFNNPLDDVYTFYLYLTLLGITYHDITPLNLVNDLKKCYRRKRQCKNQICILALFFAPEIQLQDPDFFNELQDFILRCKKQKLLSPKTLKFLEKAEYYKKNNWEMLIKSRNLYDCGDVKLRSLLFDDLNMFKRALNINDDTTTGPNSDFKVSANLNMRKKINIFNNDDSDVNIFNYYEYNTIDSDNGDEKIDEITKLSGYFENPPLSLFTIFDSKTPYISVAAALGATNIFNYLYEKGVPLNLWAENGATTAQLAGINPTDEVLSILKKENIDTREGTAGFIRCFNFDRFKRFCPLYLGREIDEEFDEQHPYRFQYATSPTKSTVLVQSVLTTNFISLKMCFENQLIDINQADGSGLTPLDIACQMGNKLIVEILVELGADLNCGNPLINAAMCGHSEIVKYILGISPDAYEERDGFHHDDDYLFRYSYHECHNKDVKFPLDIINKANSSGITPLYASIANSHYKVTRMLLMNKKTDLTKKFKDGLTYINLAASQNNVDILSVVLEYVKIPFKEHEVSPFVSAIVSGMPDTFLYLLEKERDKVDLNKVIKSSDISAIWLAVKFSQLEIVKILIEREKCNVTAVEIDLVTRNNDTDMLELLNKYYNIEEEEKNNATDVATADNSNTTDNSSYIDNNTNNIDNNSTNNLEFFEYEEESGTEAIADEFGEKDKSNLF